MIAPADQWGPFAPSLTTVERIAQLRSLRAFAQVFLGPRGRDLCRLLREAEADDAVLEHAALLFKGMPALDRRHLISAFAALHRAA